MHANLETQVAVLRAERKLALDRAERRAPLLDAAKRGAAMTPTSDAHGLGTHDGPRLTLVRRLILVGGFVIGLAVPAVAAAHAHHVTTGNGEEQVIAHGQNHAAPDPVGSGTMCGGDPAGYGLETAHHGPDAGTPGKADDGCYQTTGNVPPGADVANPVIH